MISLSIIFVMIVTLIFPTVCLIYSLKHQLLNSFLFGSLAFIISQLILRLPLLKLISNNSLNYHQFQFNHLVLFSLLIGLSAGIFEEITRFLIMTYGLKQSHSFKDGVFFGLGHGGIEALIMIGIPTLLNIAATNLPQGLASTLFLSGIERTFAILLHVGLSVIVMWGVKEKKTKYLFLAILIHTLTDSLAWIIPIFIPNSALIIEVTLILISLSLFVFCLKLRKRWNRNEEHN